MGEPDSPTEPSITLHSTWTGLITAYLGALIAVLFSASLLIAAEVNTVTVLLGVGSALLAAVVLFDMPLAAEFNQQGVVRRALLRKQLLPWERITRLRRLRTGVFRPGKQRGGGLIADMKGRKSVLVDTMESRIEFDDLRRVLGERGELLGLSADDMRPPDLRSPTWLYRRDKWKPDSAR